MDWLFENDNAKTIMSALASEDSNAKVLTMDAITVFLDLAWEVY